MRVLDLFSGTGSSTEAFVDAGWERVRVELNKDQEAEIHGSVADLNPDDLGPFDFIWASPPCTSFSLMSCGHHWTNHGDGAAWVPRSDTAFDGLALFAHTRRLVDAIAPRWWTVENPTAVARSTVGRWFYGDVQRVQVTYCAYGAPHRKPTDLWGRFPVGWVPRPRCSNGDPCHIASPRGSRTGIQSLDLSVVERSRIPYELGVSLVAAIEGREDEYVHNQPGFDFGGVA